MQYASALNFYAKNTGPIMENIYLLKGDNEMNSNKIMEESQFRNKEIIEKLMLSDGSITAIILFCQNERIMKQLLELKECIQSKEQKELDLMF